MSAFFPIDCSQLKSLSRHGSSVSMGLGPFSLGELWTLGDLEEPCRRRSGFGLYGDKNPHFYDALQVELTFRDINWAQKKSRRQRQQLVDPLFRPEGYPWTRSQSSLAKLKRKSSEEEEAFNSSLRMAKKRRLTSKNKKKGGKLWKAQAGTGRRIEDVSAKVFKEER